MINSAGDQGIEVDAGAGGSTIVGNYIGTDVSGTVARANRWSGIGIKSSNVLVGGTSAADRNVISGNSTSGYGGVEVYNSASGAIIRGNYIGTTATGTGVLANNGPGVRVFDSATGARIGGVNAGEGNVITGNSTRGVWIESGTGTSVLGNSIHGNGALGIDLATSGVLANDTGDGDTGANGKQNYPVLTKAVTTGTLVEVTGTLNSTASSYFRVEFFSSPTADSTGYGEGQTYLGRERRDQQLGQRELRRDAPRARRGRRGHQRDGDQDDQRLHDLHRHVGVRQERHGDAGALQPAQHAGAGCGHERHAPRRPARARA